MSNDTTYASRNTYVSHGGTAIIELSSEGIIKKIPWPGNVDSRAELSIEALIYAHIGQNDHLVRLISWDSDQCILSLEYMRNGSLEGYLKNETNAITRDQRLIWVEEAIKAVKVRLYCSLLSCPIVDRIEVLHDSDVIHCDVKPENFLVDDKLHLRISDFAGSSIARSTPSVCAPAKYLRPALPSELCSVQDDIFGLGSTIFKIMTGKDPYDDLKDEDVEKQYEAGKFPDTSDLTLGDMISKCWNGDIASVEVLYDLVRSSIESSSSISALQ